MEEVMQISGSMIVTLFYVIVILVGILLFITYMNWRKVGGDFVKDILESAQEISETITGRRISPLEGRVEEISSGVDTLVKFLIGKGIGLTMLIAMQHPSVIAMMNSAPEIIIAVKEILFNDYAGNKQSFMRSLLNKFDVKGSADPMIVADENLTLEDYNEMKSKALEFIDQLDDRIKVASEMFVNKVEEVETNVKEIVEKIVTPKTEAEPKAKREGGLH